ncbi:hypothetical protein J4465_03280 [Candidatus Pacearchaeota archaeon]|nr:hypothetical protein [Candidatus Pacearchaeota archaeon]
MPRISISKEEKIKEAVLQLLFQESPNSMFTYYIAQELARDEEYMKKILEELELKKFVYSVNKNPKGVQYSRRKRWGLTPNVHEAYKKISEEKAKLMAPFTELKEGQKY